MKTTLFRVGDEYAVIDTTLEKPRFFKDLKEATDFAQELCLKSGEKIWTWDDRPSRFLTKGDEKP